MNEWWEGLSQILKVLYCIAIPSTLLLVLQTILTVIGFGEGGSGDVLNASDTSGLCTDGLDVPDVDMDVSTDIAGGADTDIPDDASGNVDTDLGTLRLFTMQGIVAFATTFSWVTIWLIKGDMQVIPAFFLGALAGSLMMYAVAKIFQQSKRLAENGTFYLKRAIGEIAQVYVPIPPNGENGGKVTLTLGSGFHEIDAITESEHAISTGQQVRITDVVGDTVVVEVYSNSEP